MIASTPAGRAVVLSVAVPEGPTGAVPSVVEPSRNVIVPLGVAGPAPTLATRVSGWPKADGPPSIDTDTARAALPIVNVNGDDRAA